MPQLLSFFFSLFQNPPPCLPTSKRHVSALLLRFVTPACFFLVFCVLSAVFPLCVGVLPVESSIGGPASLFLPLFPPHLSRFSSPKSSSRLTHVWWGFQLIGPGPVARLNETSFRSQFVPGPHLSSFVFRHTCVRWPPDFFLPRPLLSSFFQIFFLAFFSLYLTSVLAQWGPFSQDPWHQLPPLLAPGADSLSYNLIRFTPFSVVFYYPPSVTHFWPPLAPQPHDIALQMGFSHATFLLSLPCLLPPGHQAFFLDTHRRRPTDPQGQVLPPFVLPSQRLFFLATLLMVGNCRNFESSLPLF